MLRQLSILNVRTLRTISLIPKSCIVFMYSLISLHSSLNWARGPIQPSTLVEILLILPQIAQVSASHIKNDEKLSTSQILKRLLGAESKETFALPNLSSLDIWLPMETDDMEFLVDFMRGHKLASEMRRIPAGFHGSRNCFVL